MAARTWVAALDAGRRDDRRYTLQWQSIGGRKIGRNRLPARAVVSSFEQAWAFLGVTTSVHSFDEILALAQQHPTVREWVLAQPHRALELAPEMPKLIAAYVWLDSHRGSRRYLREISARGVDTKFAERHRAVLAAMLDVSPTATGFLAGLGLRSKPGLVRLRPAPSLGLPAPLTEMGVRAEELAQLAVEPRVAVIVENEITYLSIDVPDDGVVIWGKGFEVDNVGRLGWLADADVLYWGDIDTHGFAILDRLRAWLPRARSVLMDRETLLANRDRWVTEDRPATSFLRRLTPDEHALYSQLVVDGLGERVRLEQERIDWHWVEQRLSAVSRVSDSDCAHRSKICGLRRIDKEALAVDRRHRVTKAAVKLAAGPIRQSLGKTRESGSSCWLHTVTRCEAFLGRASTACLMSLTRGYGETPLPDDELASLLTDIVRILGEPVTRSAVYDLEQGVQEQVAEELLTAALEGSLQLRELLTGFFLNDLHGRLYGDIWTWAGKWRTHDVNIGVAYPQIAVDLRNSLDTIVYRWENTDDWTPHELGVVAHAETVRIHPFADGNGRATRLLADLVYVAVQDSDPLLQYDWNVDKVSYINLLRRYDTNRDVTDIARLLEARPFGE